MSNNVLSVALFFMSSSLSLLLLYYIFSKSCEHLAEWVFSKLLQNYDCLRISQKVLASGRIIGSRVF